MKCVLLCFILIFILTTFINVSHQELFKRRGQGGVIYSLDRYNSSLDKPESVTVESVIPTDSVDEDSGVSVPYGMGDLLNLLNQIAVDNTVMTSFTDSGYLKHFYTFYKLSHLERYPNFFVTAIDQDAFNVGIIIDFNIVSSCKGDTSILLSSPWC